jgi:hypothetical protein
MEVAFEWDFLFYEYELRCRISRANIIYRRQKAFLAKRVTNSGFLDG